MKKCLFFILGLFIASLHFAEAQSADSLRLYVQECVSVMQQESLYSNKVDWQRVKDTVQARLAGVNDARAADELVIWVFDQLKDYHGMYGGLDSSFRSRNPAPGRIMSAGILAAYKKPRAVKLAILDGGIAYYKMPAVLIGSNQAKMKEWANLLMDSLCKLAAFNPKAYIIDLRMNNGGNSEPMWQVIRLLAGDENKPLAADASGHILPADTSQATLQYQQAAIPDRNLRCKQKSTGGGSYRTRYSQLRRDYGTRIYHPRPHKVVWRTQHRCGKCYQRFCRAQQRIPVAYRQLHGQRTEKSIKKRNSSSTGIYKQCKRRFRKSAGRPYRAGCL